jgi:hypothetical protein
LGTFLLILYPRNSICAQNSLQLEILTLISTFENRGRTISNLRRWYLLLSFVNIKGYHNIWVSFSILHTLDKIFGNDILKIFRNQAILKSMGKCFCEYFSMIMQVRIVSNFSQKIFISERLWFICTQLNLNQGFFW